MRDNAFTLHLVRDVLHFL